MGKFCSYDMKPRMEKMAKPATKLVPLFRKQRDRQSLKTAQTGEYHSQEAHSVLFYWHLRVRVRGLENFAAMLLILQSVPVTVVVIFIVASQRSQATDADGIGEEDLSSSIHPYLRGRIPTSWVEKIIIIKRCGQKSWKGFHPQGPGSNWGGLFPIYYCRSTH